MADIQGTGAFPVGWLLVPAFGTWVVVALYVFVAIPMLPTTEWGSAFGVFWVAFLMLCRHLRIGTGGEEVL
jgi:hypothetical protein